MQSILVTGGAGFIGSNLIDQLLANTDNRVTCIDNFDPFYDRSIKENNIKEHLKNDRYQFLEIDIRDFAQLEKKLKSSFDVIIHLAAKAGVRPSINNPQLYTDVNITGTQNMLEIARALNVPKFIFASSSSVYGTNPNYPWKETDHDLLPISPYASTKLSGEFLGHVYSHLYPMQFLALRFFTVFGPRQRPDLAIHKFFIALNSNTPIEIYGDGTTQRDYTFVGDAVNAIVFAMGYKQSNYEIFNVGNNHPIKLIDLIRLIEEITQRKATLSYGKEQPGDVNITFANIEKTCRLLGNYNKHTLHEGLIEFNNWLTNNRS